MKISKLLNHIINGTIRERIEIEPELRKERKWKRFVKSSRPYIIKKLPGKIKLNLYKDSILSMPIFMDKFEQHELIFASKFLKRGDIFLDIGANIGIFSLLASKKVEQQGKVYAFEPAVTTFNRLIENINLNKAKNIFPQNIALSDKNDTLKLFTSLDGYDAWNSIAKPKAGEIFEFQQTEAQTLDNFAEKNNLQGKINFIKLDVEGWELPVLRGGVKILSGDDAPVIMVEFSEQSAQYAGFSCHELFQQLIDLGYKMYSYNSINNTLLSETLQSNYSYINLFAVKNPEQVNNRLKTN